MSTAPCSLTITPVKPQDIPSEDAIIAAGKAILEESSDTSLWVQGKTFSHSVKTLSRAKRPEDGAPWHARVSVHSKDDVTFDQLWDKLGKDKAENEKEFIPEIKKATRIKDISPTQSIWSMYYTFPPPVSPRVFTVLQTVHYEESPRTGIVVSIPMDLSSPEDKSLLTLEERGVKGRYVSIERVLELDDGTVEWKMATSSTPGGSIPTFIAEHSMAKSIAADVPHLIKLIHSEKKASH